MPGKDYAVIHKMLQHVNAILEYCKDCLTLEEFQKENMRVEAVVFNLMQLGELAKTELSEDCKKEIKSIPWNQIYGLRNRIVHGYSGVKMNVVWETVKDDLPELKNELQNQINRNK